MVTDSAPLPALHVLTINSDATPGQTQTFKFFYYLRNSCKMKELVPTGTSSFQTRSKGRHEPRIADLARFSHSDLERAARNVAAIEANVDGMNTVLLWNKPDGKLIC